MTLLVQFVLSVIAGIVAWLIADVFGVPDPWPIIIGVMVFLLFMGIGVIIVDGDLFD